MTQLVSRLEREGLVIRLIDPEDARATLVAITDAGSALRAELHQSATSGWRNCSTPCLPTTRPRWLWRCALLLRCWSN